MGDIIPERAGPRVRSRRARSPLVKVLCENTVETTGKLYDRIGP
jgi:hypothetical protein